MVRPILAGVVRDADMPPHHRSAAAHSLAEPGDADISVACSAWEQLEKNLPVAGDRPHGLKSYDIRAQRQRYRRAWAQQQRGSVVTGFTR